MKLYLFSILTVLLIVPTKAQDNITSVFLTVPETVLFGADAQTKDQLVANPKDSGEVKVRSQLNSWIKRTAISADYIALETSSVGTLQIKLLPLINNSKIVCVVHTVCGKVCDSRIAFYAADWQPIANTASIFPPATLDTFIKPDADRQSEDFRNALAALDMTAVRYQLNAENDTIEAYLDLQNYLQEEDYNKIKPYLCEQPKTFHWDKVSYK
ncbi:MAG: DUF3256 family protein [Prevotella sp.]|jgi:hypothetical protein|nr:DUF3256 family protein [Prevotella sp.]